MAADYPCCMLTTPTPPPCSQVVIFVKSVARARELNRLLNECNFPSTTIHSAMRQEERLQARALFLWGAGLYSSLHIPCCSRAKAGAVFVPSVRWCLAAYGVPAVRRAA